MVECSHSSLSLRRLPVITLLLVKEIDFENRVIIASSDSYDDIWALFDSVTLVDPNGRYSLIAG